MNLELDEKWGKGRILQSLKRIFKTYIFMKYAQKQMT